MHGSNEFFSPGDGGATVAPAPPADRRVHRHLLCSIGAPAEPIAARVLALSRCGLADPPLELLAAPLAADAENLHLLAQQVEHACDRLADLELAQRRRRRGLALAAPDELRVWLLVNLAPVDTEPPTAAVDPAAVAQCQALLARTVWRRLRAHTAWHIILLLEAANQDLLVQWSLALRTPQAAEFTAQLYVLSPVNADHLRLAHDAWQEAVAQTVTALLWVAPPAHTQLERATGSPRSLAAVAALVWCSPAHLLHTWLAQAGAAQILHILRCDLETAPSGSSSPSLDEHLAALRRLCPRLPAPAQQTLHPPWAALAALPAHLAAEAERKAAAIARKSQEARLSWLDAAQSAWSEGLARLTSDHLLAPAWPRGGACLAQLLAWRQELDAGAQTVGDRLERIGLQLEEATVEFAAARQRLETLCAGFPPWSLAGAANAMMQPWRWPHWAYAYWRCLPAAAQELSAAHAAMLDQQAEEALWHTLRQHYLAAAQQTQTQIGRLQQAHRNLVAAEELASARSAAQAAAIPDPWTAQGLTWLLQHLLPDPKALRLRETLTAALAAELAPDLLFSQLQNGIADAAADVAAWSALDCLCAAFAAAASGPSAAVSLPLLWLAQCLHALAPWWPAQELAENSLAETWASIPDPHSQGEWLAAAYSFVEAWRTQAPQAEAAHSALDAVLLLRWAEVRLDLEAPASISWQEEASDDHSSLV